MVALSLEEPFAKIPSLSAGGQRERSEMTLISCIIRPDKLEAVTDALDKQHIVGMTVTDVRGFGRQRGHTEHYRGGEYAIRYVAKIKVEVAVPAREADRVLTTIEAAARTGQVGDGKVFVFNLGTAVRIRTGERGVSAL